MPMSKEWLKFNFPKEYDKLYGQQSDKIVKCKKSKYNSVKTEVDEIIFDSKKEAEYWAKIRLLKKSGEVVSIYPQPEFILQEGYVKNGKKIRPIIYRADFMVEYKDGHSEIIDVKGYKFQKVYLIKKKMFHFKYPNLTIIEV